MDIQQATIYLATCCDCIAPSCSALCRACASYQADSELAATGGDCVLSTAIGRRVRSGYYDGVRGLWARERAEGAK